MSSLAGPGADLETPLRTAGFRSRPGDQGGDGGLPTAPGKRHREGHGVAASWV